MMGIRLLQVTVLVGVEPISTLLGKVLMGYELHVNSRHYCTYLPADIARDCPACSLFAPEMPSSFSNASVEGGARSYISQSINYTSITPLNSKAWVLHRIRRGKSARHNMGATYARVVTVGFKRPRGCKRQRGRIQNATFCAAATSN